MRGGLGGGLGSRLDGGLGSEPDGGLDGGLEGGLSTPRAGRRLGNGLGSEPDGGLGGGAFPNPVKEVGGEARLQSKEKAWIWVGWVGLG